MNCARLVFCLLCVFVSSVKVLHGQEPGFINLLDPEHENGWKSCGAYGFRIQEGVARSNQPQGAKGMSTYWYSGRMFSDFVLRLEYRGLGKEYNSGVHLRFPDPGNDNEVVRNKGYEVAILRDSNDEMPTGSIYAHRKAEKPVQRGSEDWNHLEILVVGQAITVRLNGAEVTHFLGSLSRVGYIGFQNHPTGPVMFRNVRIRPITEAEPALMAMGPGILSHAVVNQTWTWTGANVNTRVEFKEDGTMIDPNRQVSRWRAIDARTLRVNTRAGASLDLTFSPDFKRYIQEGVVASPIAGVGSRHDPLCGTWKWFDRNIRTFLPDGSLSDLSGKPGGTWTCKNPTAASGETRHYRIDYNGGKFVDHLALTNGYRFLDGLNNFRYHVTAQRLNDTYPRPQGR